MLLYGRIVFVSLINWIQIVADKKNDAWVLKVERTLTSILPVARNRTGKCTNCGECCKLPNVCPFLEFKQDGQSYCSIHPLRPLNCRRYPRTESECITKDVCGFKFE